MNRRELDYAIQSSFDGTLTEAACLDLREILKSDPAARALYFQYADLHQSLIFRISHFTRTDAARSLAVVRRKIQHRSTIRIAISAAAAVLIGMGAVLRLTLVPTTPALATFQEASGSLYTVKHLGGDNDLTAGELDPGSVVNLTQGTLEVELLNGSRGVILAPAKFQLLSEKAMFLYQGTAWFRISREGVGFQITTPGLVVTDLGTVFGVRSDSDFGDEIHVFSGSVRAHDSKRPESEETLTAGLARRRNPLGGLEDIPPSPESFLTKLPTEHGTGLIVNGDFEAGSPPPDEDFGSKPSAAYLPGWSFGRDISVTLNSEDGPPGHGVGSNTIVSSTRDVQVGFRNRINDEVGTLDDSIWQTFATVPSQQYEVSFEMGGYFTQHTGSDLRIAATVYDGISTSGTTLGSVEDRRAGDQFSDSGYNERVRFVFTARSNRATLVLTETSPNTDLASPAIDNVTVEKVPD